MKTLGNSIIKVWKPWVCLLVVFLTMSGRSDVCAQAPIAGTLSNQFSYFIKQSEQGRQKIHLRLVLRVGSVMERKDELGYAHFLEHMAFKGTSHFPNASFTEGLVKNGLSYGVDFNAYTSYDHTVYSLDLPASMGLENALVYFADILDGLVLDESYIESEKKIVLEELRAAKPSSAFDSLMLYQTRYLHRPPLGTNDCVMSITRKDLLRFYHQWYGPQNAVVIIVGDFDQGVAEKAIKRNFSSIPKARSKAERSAMLNSHGVKLRAVIDTTISRTEVALTWPVALLQDSVSDPVGRVFRQLMAHRLYGLEDLSNVRVSKNYFLADAVHEEVSFTTDLSAEAAIGQVLQMYHDIMQFGVSEQEIHAANKNLYRSSKAEKLSSEQWVAHLLDVSIGKKNLKDTVRIQRSVVTSADLQRYARQRLRSGQLLVGLTQQKSVDVKVLTSQVKQNLRMPSAELVSSYHFEPDTVSHALVVQPVNLEVPLLEPQQPSTRKHYADLGITQLYYANGAEVILKPTGTASKEIYMQAFAKGGTSSIPDSLYAFFASTPSYMELGNIAGLTEEALDRYLTDKMIGVNMNLTEYDRQIYGIADEKDLEEFFKFLYLKMTSTVLDSSVFYTYVNEEIASYGDHPDIPSSPGRTFDAQTAMLSDNYFPKRYEDLSLRQLKLLEVNQVQAYYQKLFGTGFGWTFTFVGNFKVDELERFASLYLGNLPVRMDVAANKPLRRALLCSDTTYVESEDLEKQKTMRTVFYYGDYIPGFKNHLKIRLLGSLLNERIMKMLREQHGLVYTPYVSYEYKPDASSYLLSVNFTCDPANAATVQQLIADQIEAFKREPVALDELLIAQKAILFRKNSDLTPSNSHAWLNKLTQLKHDFETMDEFEHYEQILRSITPERLQQFVIQSLSVESKLLILE